MAGPGGIQVVGGAPLQSIGQEPFCAALPVGVVRAVEERIKNLLQRGSRAIAGPTKDKTPVTHSIVS
jgi:hypothetical protein